MTVVAVAPLDAADLDIACATDVYWGDRPFPSPEPFNLGACQHRTEIRFPPSDTVIPVVVVNRVTGDFAIELTPSG
jgi:hypothetical protein